MREKKSAGRQRAIPGVYRLGNFAFLRKEAKAALAAWKSALAIAPSPVEAEGVRIHLARIHAQLGEADAARALLAKVHETHYAELKAGILRKLETPPKP